jgi:hypothetical protein
MTWFEREAPVVVGKGATAHELLKIIYQCPDLPLHTRMRAAMACLPFENAKLGITYQATATDFASMLDARIKRHQAKLIEYQRPSDETRCEQPAVTIQTPMPRPSGRGFRRI